jgi:NAD(P)-dependent dehydrogenase (short-subunit alcohol dehydrogenase family)
MSPATVTPGRGCWSDLTTPKAAGAHGQSCWSTSKVTPIVLVTGATSGIGQATVGALGAAGAQVVVHGRTQASADQAAHTAQQQGVDVVGAIGADLADRQQTEDLAAAADALNITGLVNNAGVYLREHTLTADGRETTWVVNHLHPTLLTVLVLDGLLDRGGRVLNISAVVHARARMDLSDPEFSQRRYSHFHAYANSKLANLLMAQQMAEHHAVPGYLTFNAVHPGVVSTKLLLDGMGVEGHDEADAVGADIAALVTDPSYLEFNGQYFTGRQPAEPTGPGTDQELAAHLYEMTMTELGFD